MRFSGHEELSSLYEFQLELACEESALSFSDVVGQQALLTIEGEQAPRHVHGIVSRFEQVGSHPRYTRYQATLVPLVWRLRHRRDNRIFQDLSTPDILKQVLRKAGVSSEYFELRLSGTYEPRNYCVQYRESDWDFLSRLMEEDGIFHFFEHRADMHVLVMGDDSSACQPIAGTEALVFRHERGLVTEVEQVVGFRFSEEIQSGLVSLRDFNFKKPDLPMDAEHEAEQDTDLEVYDYPGEYQDPTRGSSAKGGGIAKLRLEELQARRKVGHGESDCERLVPGSFFTLAEHARGDFNIRYLLTHVEHRGHQPQVLDEEAPSSAFSYSNTFSCLSAKVPFRPSRRTPRPVVRGVQTALVVGPAGEEIHVDEHGRVKVQFHWDRQGQRNDKSSCWVRVSQPWGGESWGGMFIPRVGQEVIVDFIEGDPDRPLITGRVYNGTSPPPHPLPDAKTKSSMRTNSSPGGGGFNELRFEDKKGAEQVFIHSQRNMDVHVKNDSLEDILNDRHQSIKRDQNEEVSRDKSLKVHRDSQEHVGGDVKLLVGGIDGPGHQHIHIKASRKELVDADSHLRVGGNRNERVGASWSLSVGEDLQVHVGLNHALAAGQEIHLSAPTVVIDATQGLTLKVGANFITLDPASISVMGTVLNLNSGGAALDGRGVKLTQPEAPADAQPTAPTPADDGG
ncbi:VgrG protein [Cystobacter fuscus DSM 2262]|uniref:VgrG protein n=1 Tax=Cystobacter fuscus (strain ATCC 25194 / DSM 2262 / NBRC 100088 / M29) TaxID=1242864 RepID=S9QIG0_CYSF2|nr:VgrG protein [Cystobacter fuscus DSM 2262]